MADKLLGGEAAAVMELAGRVDSLVRSSTVLHARTTKPTELVDLTDRVSQLVADSRVGDGMLWLFCLHTSCGLVINENETGFKEDLIGVLEELAPVDRYWAHNDPTRRWENVVEGERPNGHSHVRAVLATHPCLAVPIVEGSLALGRWQRTFLLELDGGRERRLIAQIWSGGPGVGLAGASGARS